MSRNEDTSLEDDGRENHPALKDFNETAFKAKYILTKALTYGGIGGLAGGAALGAFKGLVGLAIGKGAASLGIAGIGKLFFMGPYGILAGIAGVVAAPFLAGAAVTGIAGAAMSGVMTGLTVGGIGGAVIGAVMGFSGADDAVEQEKEKLVARYEQMQDLHERKQARAQYRSKPRGASMDMGDEAPLPAMARTRSAGRAEPMMG